MVKTAERAQFTRSNEHPKAICNTAGATRVALQQPASKAASDP